MASWSKIDIDKIGVTSSMKLCPEVPEVLLPCFAREITGQIEVGLSASPGLSTQALLRYQPAFDHDNAAIRTSEIGMRYWVNP